MSHIALTGGIASGKSMVADELQRRGAVIIDSDVLAREVVEPGTRGLGQVVERFGEAMLLKDGSLNRARMGELVFSDEQARSDLNAIVHPLVRERSEELAARAPEGSVVVHVIPLLVETGLDKTFEHVIVVDVPAAMQVRRLGRRNDLDTEAAWARVRAQASRQERLAVADWVVDNSGDQASTVRQIDELWPQLTALASGA